MSNSFSTTFRVGRKYLCTVSYPVDADDDGISTLSMTWSPRTPYRLTSAERRDWRRGIQMLTDEIARRDGVPFVVVEV
jgi:hypothetical protein